MKEVCIYILLVIFISIITSLLKKSATKTSISHLSTYESLIIFEGNYNDHASLPFYKRIYYLSESETKEYDGIETIRLIRSAEEIPKVFGNYQSLQLREEAYNSSFMEIQNIHKYMNKVLFLPGNKDECSGELQHRTNGLTFCKINVNINYIIELAKKHNQIINNSPKQSVSNQTPPSFQQVKQQTIDQQKQQQRTQQEQNALNQQQQTPTVALQQNKELVVQQQSQQKQNFQSQLKGEATQEIKQNTEQTQNSDGLSPFLKEMQNVTSQIILMNQNEDNHSQPVLQQTQISQIVSVSIELPKENMEQKAVEMLPDSSNKHIQSSTAEQNSKKEQQLKNVDLEEVKIHQDQDETPLLQTTKQDQNNDIQKPIQLPRDSQQQKQEVIEQNIVNKEQQSVVEQTNISLIETIQNAVSDYSIQKRIDQQKQQVVAVEQKQQQTVENVTNQSGISQPSEIESSTQSQAPINNTISIQQDATIDNQENLQLLISQTDQNEDNDTQIIPKDDNVTEDSVISFNQLITENNPSVQSNPSVKNSVETQGTQIPINESQVDVLIAQYGLNQIDAENQTQETKKAVENPEIKVQENKKEQKDGDFTLDDLNNLKETFEGSNALSQQIPIQQKKENRQIDNNSANTDKKKENIQTPPQSNKWLGSININAELNSKILYDTFNLGLKLQKRR